MNPQPEPMPTELSQNPHPDRTTVPSVEPTAGETNDNASLTIDAADDAQATTVREDDGRKVATPSPTVTLGSCDTSLSPQSLGFAVNRDPEATEEGESADVTRGLTTSEAAPRGGTVQPGPDG